MTAQEWLNELEGLRKAATPGPWTKSEQGTNETYHHRIARYYKNKEIPKHIAYVVLPNVFGNLSDAAYIVAACNAVPRLVEMIIFLASLASDGDESPDAIERRIQWAYNETRPKE